MRERPILFSDEMVRAILDGRKTETRRVVKPELPTWEQAGDRYGFWRIRSGRFVVTGSCSAELVRRAEVRLFGRSRLESVATRGLRSPYGAPGDLLYVRECWSYEPGGTVIYRSDYDAESLATIAKAANIWRPSIHMRKADARIWLRVAEVRIERLQEITVSDIRAEGVKPESDIGPMDVAGIYDHRGAYRDAWISLWDSINAGRGYPWASDPWVWVVRFEVVSTTGRDAVLEVM